MDPPQTNPEQSDSRSGGDQRHVIRLEINRGENRITSSLTRNTGRGVYACGKPKTQSNVGGEGKPTVRNGEHLLAKVRSKPLASASGVDLRVARMASTE
jgi:hypothetical protein